MSCRQGTVILLSNLLSEDRVHCCFVHVSNAFMVVWLMIEEYIFATLEVSVTTSITKIAEATFAAH